MTDEKEVETPSGKPNAAMGYVILAALLVVGFLVIRSSSSTSSNAPDKIEAYTAAEMLVKDKLKAPSTAEFSGYSSSSVKDLGDGKWEVAGYVDAENSFGATLRSGFLAIINYTGEGGFPWEAETVKLLNQ